MKFIYPLFLWALFLIAIPIIIHLLNLRKHRTVYFSNVDLLKTIKKASRKRSKLKELLILLSRIAAIVLLVFAFAKPYIPQGGTVQERAKNITGIYIDNSYSMNTDGPEGRAFESARQKAYSIVNGSKPDTRFFIITNDFDIYQNRLYSRTEMIQLIGNIEVSHNVLPMSMVQTRFSKLMEDFLFETNRSLYFISDFQQFSADINNFEQDTAVQYNFLPVKVNTPANIYIDSCWFEEPTHHLSQNETLYAKLINGSNEDYYKLPVNFYLNDTLRALATVDLPAQQELIVSLQYKNLRTGLHVGRVEITDYPIVYDNTMHVAYEVQKSLNVLVVESNPDLFSKYVQAMYANDDYVQLDVVLSNRLRISSLKNYSVIFLNALTEISSGLADELKQYVQQGGSLLIIPPEELNFEAYSDFLQSFNMQAYLSADTVQVPLYDIPYEHILYKNVFSDKNRKVEMPVIKKRFLFNEQHSFSGQNILMFADNNAALVSNTYDRGKVYAFSFPLSNPQNRFVDHVMFFPTIYNIVLQSIYPQKTYYVIGVDNVFDFYVSDENHSFDIVMEHLQSKNEIIPELTRVQGNTLRFAINENFDSGVYVVKSSVNNQKGIAFNYELKESDFTYHKTDEIKRMAELAGIQNVNLITIGNKNLQAQIEVLDKGIQLWKLFVIIAFVFILAEAAIIKLMP